MLMRVKFKNFCFTTQYHLIKENSEDDLSFPHRFLMMMTNNAYIQCHLLILRDFKFIQLNKYFKVVENTRIFSYVRSIK